MRGARLAETLNPGPTPKGGGVDQAKLAAKFFSLASRLGAENVPSPRSTRPSGAPDWLAVGSGSTFSQRKLRSRQGDPMRFARLAALATLALGVVAAPLGVGAQGPGKVPLVGYALARVASENQHVLDAVRQGLRDLGYVEGQNIALE